MHLDVCDNLFLQFKNLKIKDITEAGVGCFAVDWANLLKRSSHKTQKPIQNNYV